MSSLTIDRRFSVDAPPEAVWRFLIDPAVVVTCLPGATLVSSSEDGRLHEGTVTVKLGTIGVSYRGTAEFVEVDDEHRRLRMRAKGREKVGAGSADMSMTSRVLAAGVGSEVSIEATVTVTGKIVALGRGMIEIVSEQLLTDFATTLCQRVSAPPAEPPPVKTLEGPAATPKVGATKTGGAPPKAAPLNAFSLLLRAIWARISRLFEPD